MSPHEKLPQKKIARPFHNLKVCLTEKRVFSSCKPKSLLLAKDHTMGSCVLQGQMVRFPRLLGSALLTNFGLHGRTGSLWDDRDKKLTLST